VRDDGHDLICQFFGLNSQEAGTLAIVYSR
jgi:hypothetical protein